jgi:hypothetical protein
MTKQDWLHKSHEGLYDQGNRTFGYILIPANRDRMGFGTTTAQGIWLDTQVAPEWDAFKAAYVDWSDPAERTQNKTIALKKAEDEFIPLYRKLYSALKNHLLVTDEDLNSMGLPVRGSGERHRAPIAKDAPDVDADTSTHTQVSFHFFEKGSKHKKGKPEGQHGAEIIWTVREEAPVRYEELLHSSFSTNPPAVLRFENDQRGCTVYFALRWENTRGEKGPWSNIQSVVIP